VSRAIKSTRDIFSRSARKCAARKADKRILYARPAGPRRKPPDRQRCIIDVGGISPCPAVRDSAIAAGGQRSKKASGESRWPFI